MNGKRTPNSSASEREVGQQTRPSGSVAGAVLRSARCSVGLSQAALAELADVSEATVSSWEDGSSPLAETTAHQIDRLERELLAAGADPHLVADLAPGAWCDVVNQSAADGEDTGCLLADPLAQAEAFRELLSWAVTGQPPERHQSYASVEHLALTANPALLDEVTEILGADHRSPPAQSGSATIGVVIVDGSLPTAKSAQKLVAE